jgi:hypothetical protein
MNQPEAGRKLGYGITVGAELPLSDKLAIGGSLRWLRFGRWCLGPRGRRGGPAHLEPVGLAPLLIRRIAPGGLMRPAPHARRVTRAGVARAAHARPAARGRGGENRARGFPFRPPRRPRAKRSRSRRVTASSWTSLTPWLAWAAAHVGGVSESCRDKAGVVLVIHAIFGLSDWIRGLTRSARRRRVSSRIAPDPDLRTRSRAVAAPIRFPPATMS